ncbi:MAG TPA: methionine adenosyltransferase [Candidatus Atribacteria bacterium]|nr:methionine adenosyltransferase [Candidatus Atribacteria bacterium]HPZ81194.1 methionine adenosyltransferase [Candidatus Atribacteria bacterium]
MERRYQITSESVTEGHPDKISDQISDAILDAILAQDPRGRVAVETLVATGLILIAGQVSTNSYVDIPHVARSTVRDIGYTRAKYGFDFETCAVLTAIDEQSPDIALGVNRSLEVKMGEEVEDEELSLGAGDQGMMYGYACNETPELMPFPIVLAHRLAFRLAEVRKKGILPYLRPDGKTQVTVDYVDDKPVRVDNIVISAQHHPDISLDTLREDIWREVIDPVVPRSYRDNGTQVLVNPTGRFVIGGPQGDTGLTGRKIIVDTYGGISKHGGGCFSGKDPTKVDRSGSYAARHVAKNVVAAGLADKCEFQLAYAIGVARPVSMNIDTKGTGKIPDNEILHLVKEVFDLRPGAIIKNLGLRRPIYKKTAVYGHFGRNDPDFSWEKTDKASILREKAGL